MVGEDQLVALRWALRDSNPRPAGCKADLTKVHHEAQCRSSMTFPESKRLLGGSLRRCCDSKRRPDPRLWDACWDERSIHYHSYKRNRCFFYEDCGRVVPWTFSVPLNQ